MEVTNSSDYYSNSTRFGEYQYVTLEEVINNYLMSRSDDDMTSSEPRYRILYNAMRGMRELYYDVVREIRAIELELSPTLTITLPPDYVNYVRISWVDDSGQLHPMALDNRMSMANVYLQDDKYDLLFDSDGCVLQGSDRLHDESGLKLDQDSDVSYYSFCDGGYRPNLDMSKVYRNGKYNVDKSKGIIHFGSNVEGKNIVLEYISDGLYTGCEGKPEEEIRINKFAESALLSYIYWQLIINRRKVSGAEKQRASKEFFRQRRIAKRRINTIRLEEIIQLFRGQSKVIK